MAGGKKGLVKYKPKPLPTGQQTIANLFGKRPPADTSIPAHAHIVVEASAAEVPLLSLDEEIVEQTPPTPAKQPTPQRKASPVPVNPTYPIFEKRKPVVQQEIIDITNDEQPVAGPSRPPMARTTRSQSSRQLKPGAPIPKAKSRTTTPPRGDINGSRTDPIVLDSPLKPLSGETQRLVLKPPGAPPRASTPQVLVRGMTPFRLKAAKETEIHHPTGEGQHVRGPQSTYNTPELVYSRRGRPKSSTSTVNECVGFLMSPEQAYEPSNAFLYSKHNPNALVDGVKQYLATIPPEQYTSSPVLSRVLVDPPPQQLWTDKYRPTKAVDVLGAEQHSLYLRDWMHALKLQQQSPPKDQEEGKKQGTKRPRIIRAVEKVRKKARREGYELEWVVDEHEEEEENEPWDEDDDVALCERTLAQLKAEEGNEDTSKESNTVPFGRHDFDESLSNTILLTGPPGSCKTAAVYACAQELDWDVFEVYPGIGKRSGIALDNLVGDVGKNHLVRKAQLRKGMNAFAALLTKGKEGEESGVVDTSEAVAEAPSNVRQSLVLIEECDILYNNDHGFWLAVVKLIKECKRPVVLTCNDMSLVPREELPLQATLGFEPCPSPLAVSYMQTICATEGTPVDRQKLVELFHTTQSLDSIDMPSTPLNPRAEKCPRSDLRRALHNLQVLLTLAEPPVAATAPQPATSSEPVDPTEDFQQFATCVERMSFMDAHLQRGPLLDPESLTWSGSLVSSDDTRGHTHVYGPFGASKLYEPIGHSTTDRSMTTTLVEGSGMGLPEEWLTQATSLFVSTVEYQSRMLSLLSPLIPIDAPLMPSSSVYLDYEPCIRAMVRLDDAYSAKDGALAYGSRPTRTTRGNPQWTRMVSFESEEKLQDYRTLALS